MALADSPATFQFNNPKLFNDNISKQSLLNKIKSEEFDRLKFFYSQIKSKLYFLQQLSVLNQLDSIDDINPEFLTIKQQVKKNKSEINTLKSEMQDLLTSLTSKHETYMQKLSKKSNSIISENTDSNLNLNESELEKQLQDQIQTITELSDSINEYQDNIGEKELRLEALKSRISHNQNLLQLAISNQNNDLQQATNNDELLSKISWYEKANTLIKTMSGYDISIKDRLLEVVINPKSSDVNNSITITIEFDQTCEHFTSVHYTTNNIKNVNRTTINSIIDYAIKKQNINFLLREIQYTLSN